jgi:hypothetical protein
MKKLTSIFIILISLSVITNCATAGKVESDEYGILGSAVSACSSAMIGVYGDTIPDAITANDFLTVCENNTPKGYYSVLKKYPLDIQSKKTYYFLQIYDPDSKALILFDYSCTPKPDGLVLTNPGKYDHRNLDLYDPCKEKQ